MRVVVASRVGRLANRILLFAHFAAAALEHGFVVHNPAFAPQAGYFPATSRAPVPRFPPGLRVPAPAVVGKLGYPAAVAAANVLHRRQAAGRDAGLIRLRRDEHLDLGSEEFLAVLRRHRVVFVQDWFFRDAASCERHRAAIREFFTPRRRHLENARALVAAARGRNGSVVGVHVRRGDYRTFKAGRFLYSHEQYRSLMEQVACGSGEDIAFLVCSDEPVPAAAFRGLDVHYGNGHELEDLYALAACDRLLGPPSTYSKWAAYYGDLPLWVVDDPAARLRDDSFRRIASP